MRRRSPTAASAPRHRRRAPASDAERRDHRRVESRRRSPRPRSRPTAQTAGQERTDAFGIDAGLGPGRDVHDGHRRQGDRGPRGAVTRPTGSRREFPSEQPAHEVTLTKGYWIDTDEVTNAAFAAFVDAGGYTNQALWSPDGWSWLGGQGRGTPAAPLPGRRRGASADVPDLVRGGGVRRLARRPAADRGRVGVRGTRPEVHGLPVGRHVRSREAPMCSTASLRSRSGAIRPASSWVGANDMAGNAMEWVSDWLAVDYYATSPRDRSDRPGDRHDQGREGRLVGEQRVRRSLGLPALRGSADLRRQAHRLPGRLAVSRPTTSSRWVAAGSRWNRRTRCSTITSSTSPAPTAAANGRASASSATASGDSPAYIAIVLRGLRSPRRGEPSRRCSSGPSTTSRRSCSTRTSSTSAAATPRTCSRSGASTASIARSAGVGIGRRADRALGRVAVLVRDRDDRFVRRAGALSRRSRVPAGQPLAALRRRGDATPALPPARRRRARCRPAMPPMTAPRSSSTARSWPRSSPRDRTPGRIASSADRTATAVETELPTRYLG